MSNIIIKYNIFVEKHGLTPKGKKVQKRYLSTKPDAMKKEIDEFRGKDKYKDK